MFVSQDSQGFANTSFARFCNSQFCKNSQIGFLFPKFRKFFAMGRLLSPLLMPKGEFAKLLTWVSHAP